jgi:hypothetical protein
MLIYRFFKNNHNQSEITFLLSFVPQDYKSSGADVSRYASGLYTFRYFSENDEVFKGGKFIVAHP